MKAFICIVLVLFIIPFSSGAQVRTRTNAGARPRTSNQSGSACSVNVLQKSDLQGIRLYAPDGRRFLVNQEDEKKISQIYIGEEGPGNLNCISCSDISGGPKAKRMKMQPRWHPSGRWIVVAVEREKYSPPPVLGWSRKYVEGMLQSGLWTNMYAVSPDGKQWHQLTDFTDKPGDANGYTGPAFTNDGRRAVWSQIVDGNILKYTFGKWDLITADFEEREGVPRFTNVRNITPPGMNWNEPANFGPDNETLLLTGSVEKDARGMDQYLLNVRTGDLRNLTNTPKIWDEHGVLSPDGEKIVFMSAYPYRDDPKSSNVLSIKTEFMLMDSDGGNLMQLTHFREPGYPEYGDGIAATPVWSPDGKTVYLSRLVFPKYEYWEAVFQGNCGNRYAQPR